MKKEHWLIGALALLGIVGYIYYDKRSKTITSQNALSGNLKGYSNLMKLSPSYYNNTSTNGAGSDKAETFSDEATGLTPWTLGFNGGDAMEISAGWTGYPDTYSSIVSHSWQQEAIAGSHL